MRHTSRDRRNRIRLQKIGHKLRRLAKQRKKERRQKSAAAKSS